MTAAAPFAALLPPPRLSADAPPASGITPPRGHLHSLLAQCPLPYRDPKAPAWISTNGRHTFVVSGGFVAGGNGKAVGLGVPYGSRARLILAHVQSYAVLHRTPVVPIGRSFTAFIKSMGFRVSGGANGSLSQFREQTLRLAASNWTFATVDPTRGTVDNRFDRLWAGVELFYQRETGVLQLSQWPTELRLTDSFYENLLLHALPIDMHAYTALSDNPRAMDVYCWLAQRLRRIHRGRPLILTMQHIATQFAAGDKNPERAGVEIHRAFDRALAVYPSARVERELVQDGRKRSWQFTLHHSPAPITPSPSLPARQVVS